MSVNCAAVIGMTASLARADGKCDNITSLIGPKAYELTYDDAIKSGLITPVRNILVNIQMALDMMELYNASQDADTKRLIALLNPIKLGAFNTLLAQDSRSKVVVYCDKIAALPVVERLVKSVGEQFYKGTVHGGVAAKARVTILENMRSSKFGCIIMSRCGSSSIDIPDLDVVFELDVSDGALQKLTQRIGRAQRLHQSKSCARFYTFASLGTREPEFVANRKQTTVDVIDAESTEAVNVEGVPADARSVKAFIESLKKRGSPEEEEEDPELPKNSRARLALRLR